MAAFSSKQVAQQIGNAQRLAGKIAEVQVAIYQFLENEEVLTQNWTTLGTDFPELVGGTQQQTDPITIEGNELRFSPQQLNQFDSAVQILADALDGNAVTVTTNLGRNIRRLTNGVV